MTESLVHACERFVSTGHFENAAKLIEGMVADPTQTARIHPLGFVYFDLGTHDPFRYRLHVWSPHYGSLQSIDAMVHDHIFDLQSRCIVGTLQNDIYSATPSLEGLYHMHTVEYDAEASHLRNSHERWSASVSKSVPYNAGQAYALEAGVFHATKILGSGICATALVTKYRSEFGPARVLIPEGSTLDSAYHRRFLDREQSLAVVTDVSRQLTGRL